MTKIDHPNRRHLLKGAAAAPLAGSSLAAVLANPKLTRAAAEALDIVSQTTTGGKNVAAALARPDAGKAPAIVLIHEWWGLNDQIKAVAAEFAKLGYVALAVDLYDGQVTDQRSRAGQLAGGVDQAAGEDTLASWIRWLRIDAGVGDRVGTVGWCFGGGWSLTASTVVPVDATVIYYGRVTHGADRLRNLRGPVLGHFATRDRFINQDMVAGFEARMAEIGKPFTTHWYEADHAFANPTSARYDAEDATLAWQRTLDFFTANLSV